MLQISRWIQPAVDAAESIVRSGAAAVGGTTGAHLAAARLDLYGSSSESRFEELTTASAGADSAAIRQALEALSPEEQAELVRARPELVGGTDGVPAEMRYAANRLLIEAAHDQAVAAGDIDRGDLLAGFLEGDRQFLLFDPVGDGRAVEVIGELETADNVATMVPGINNSLENFEGFSDDAVRLQAEAELRAPGESTAVIAWLGYDTPETLNSPWNNTAEATGPELVDFFEGLGLAESVDTTVIGHSYGSVVTGVALREGLTVDNVAVIGSPGMQVDHVSDFDLPAGTDFYAGRAPLDYVSWTENFGLDPSDSRFGAFRFETGDGDDGQIRFHSQYYGTGSESLRNLALIAADHDGAVTLREPSLRERATGVVDDVKGIVVDGPADLVQAGVGELEAISRSVEDFVQSQVPLGPLGGWIDGAQDLRSDVVEGFHRTVDIGQRLASPDLYGDILSDVAETGVVQRTVGRIVDAVGSGLERTGSALQTGYETVRDAASSAYDRGRDFVRSLNPFG